MNAQTIVLLAVFFFTLGCCIGSFLNVVIWRLPHSGRVVTFGGKSGPLTLSWPPSHCPNCHTAVQWYQNVPVLAWLVLRGRCAKCKTSLAVRYPLVELGTGVVFAGLFLAYFSPTQTPLFSGLPHGYPAFLLDLFLVACLLAASAIDADWYIIPLGIPTMVSAVALIAAPFIDHRPMFSIEPRGPWALPTIGAAVGLLSANLLLWRRLIPQSFASFTAEGESEQPAPAITPLPVLSKKVPSLVGSLVIIAVAAVLWGFATPQAAALGTLCAGIFIFLIGVLPRDEGSPDVTDEVLAEISAPKARMEVSKEFLFLAFPILGAIVAATLPIPLPPVEWLGRLLGAVLGILAGGGVVWLIRIGGTLGFGREAMGLGDVHLMAAVGAVLGAPLAILAFFLAPFLGLLWSAVLLFLKKPNVLPYGPWLSVASILSMLVGNSIILRFLARM